MFLGKQGNLWIWIHFLIHRLRDDSLLRSSIFIMGSALVTSAIGYLYWILATHIYSTHDIGLASAFISIMSLTSAFANSGIGSALVQTLPQREAGYAWSLTLNACLIMGTLTSLLAGIIVTIALPFFSPQFSIIKYNLFYSFFFVIGVIACTIVTLLDQTFIAERATSNMALRNGAFALLKLVILLLLVQVGALGIFSSWVLALATTIVLALLMLIPRLKRDYRFIIHNMTKQIRPMLSSFLGHHLINIGSMLPLYLLPVLVSIRLTVTDNAYFYTTWMVSSLFFMVSPAVATALFSEGSHARSDVMRKARTSILTIGILLGPIMLVFFLGGRYIMLLFGPSYPQHGLLLLTFLIIAAVPDAITNVYVSLLRVQRRLQQAVLLNLGMAILTVILAWILLPTQGIAGAGLAWLIAQSAGSLLVGVDFLIARGRGFVNIIVEESATNALYENKMASFPVKQSYMDAEAISLIDTAILPNVRLLSGHQFKRDEFISSIGTEALPVIRLASPKVSYREDSVSLKDEAVLPNVRLASADKTNGVLERTTNPRASSEFHNKTQNNSPFRHITIVPLREDETIRD